MGLLDEYLPIFKSYASEWIQIKDKFCPFTLDSVPYGAAISDGMTDHHCWVCITVNKCWFKNEEGKKPEHFDYSTHPYSSMGKNNKGIYHPFCHCREYAINVPKLKDIELIIDNGKYNYFFKNKLGWYYKMGYKDVDKNDFIKLTQQLAINAYRKGDYEKEDHTKCGYKINLFISIPGKNEKKNKIYNVKTCYIIFPNGKLRLITCIGDWNENL